MSNFPVAEVCLNESQIGAALGEVIPAGVAQTVGMQIEMAEPGPRGGPVEQELHTTRRERTPSFRGEDQSAGAGQFASEPPQRADLNPAQPVIPGQPVLQPLDVQDAVVEIEMRPAQAYRFRDAQPVREHRQQQRRVPDRPSALPGGGDEPLDLLRGEMFAIAQPAGRPGMHVPFGLFALRRLGLTSPCRKTVGSVSLARADYSLKGHQAMSQGRGA
jgi:hypothetical protein